MFCVAAGRRARGRRVDRMQRVRTVCSRLPVPGIETEAERPIAAEVGAILAEGAILQVGGLGGVARPPHSSGRVGGFSADAIPRCGWGPF